MASFEDLRRYALTLPEVREVPWYAETTLTARGKGFAYSWRGRALLRLGRERLEFLLEVRPDTFGKFALPGGNWASVDLAHLEEDELQGLVREAWAGVVPKKLARGLTSLS
ncbi:MmcQ/YjbR family DNA-binding protein [Phenylobacterium sp.]|jgi:hypothetical protein|uniref:MmcQ/YjbR family DNA-binding protein n=1 Tax=Phenylobacterium sp. TaxID=1871053 RepID=UPI002F92CA1B